MSDGLVWQALPRVHIQDLPYERFLREFALPKQPFILEGASAGWKAASRWADLSYLAEHVNPKQKVSYTTCSARYQPEQEKETQISAGEALKRLRLPPVADLADLVYQDLEGLEPEPEPELPVRYIKTWDYVRGDATKLQDDIVVPSIFDRSSDALSQQAVLGNSSTDMKWLYIGEPGTGSGTHIDTNNSSAWLWVARGAKHWRCVHGGDFHLFASEDDDFRASSSGGEDDSSEDGYSGPPLPNLFEPNVSQFPQLRAARLFEGEQREGDICFNPTQCIHAVHNTRFTVSLTHNYVDATNLGDALVDVVETFEEDLPMLAEMRRSDRLEFWSETLQVESDSVCAALLDVASLVSASVVENAVEKAAKGDEQCAALLHTSLAPHVAKVRPRLLELVDTFLEQLM